MCLYINIHIIQKRELLAESLSNGGHFGFLNMFVRDGILSVADYNLTRVGVVVVAVVVAVVVVVVVVVVYFFAMG